MYIVLPDLCGRRHWILMWLSISLEWYGMVEIGEHEFIKMQCLFLWISRWKRLAKYVKLEACTFNFLILSPLTNKIHNINILTHFRFGQSCIAFILFVKVIYTRKDIMYTVNIKYIYKREIVKQHMQHSFPHWLLLTVVVKYYAYFNYAVHTISTLKGICVYQTLCYFEIPYIHLSAG